jgi:16S rRNA (guanine527-N7)-methyltransferase
LLAFAEELVRWNKKINLTAVATFDDVLEKHIIDSLALLRLPLSGSLLDIGSGAGLPGLPLKFVRRDLDVTVVDSAQKKVGFMKHVIAQFGLSPGARALHARADGLPDQEGLVRADWVVSRAFKEPIEWLRLGVRYVKPDGSVVAMLGAKKINREEVERAGLRVSTQEEYRLPFSQAARSIFVVRPTTQDVPRETLP